MARSVDATDPLKFNITDAQGFTQYKSTNQNFARYDLTTSTWGIRHVDQCNPFRVEGSQQASVEIIGGGAQFLADATMDPTAPRAKVPGGLYNDFNSASCFVQSVVNAHIHDLIFGTDDWQTAIGHNWDCIRLNGSGGQTDLIERTWIRGCRDDCAEMDSRNGSGTCTFDTNLWEGVFAGVSCTGVQSTRTIRFINHAQMNTNFFFDQGTAESNHTFGPMWKPDGTTNSPNFYCEDAVFAFHTYDGGPMPTNGQHGWSGRVPGALNNMTCGPDVYLCVLAAGGLPSNFPTSAIPAGMTVLTGSAAQSKWNTKRAQLVAEITGTTTGGGWVTRNVCSMNTSTRVITIDRRLAVPATTFTVNATNAGGSDTEDFAVTVS